MTEESKLEMMKDGSISMNEFCRIVSISRTMAYQLLNAGSLRAAKLRGKLLIPRSEVARILSENLITGGK